MSCASSTDLDGATDFDKSNSSWPPMRATSSSQVVDRFAAARLSVGAAAEGCRLPRLEHERHKGYASSSTGVQQSETSSRVAVFDGLEQLLDHDWRLRLAAPDVTPEDVHKARVAARRLRSNLRTLGSVLDPVWTGHVRDDLKWIGSALGDIRDVDVLTGLLAAAPGDLQARLSRDRAAAVERLMPKLIESSAISTCWTGFTLQQATRRSYRPTRATQPAEAEAS